MMRLGTVWVAIGLFLSVGFSATQTQQDLAAWTEFVAAVKDGRMTPDMVRPYEGVSKDALLQQLGRFKGWHDQLGSWKEWENPEVHSVGNLTHYIVTFTWGGQTKSDFCFTLAREGGRWRYVHVENIFIRLDRVTDLPASDFPDLPEGTKASQREEIYWSQMVYFQSVLAREKGKDFFLNLLKDGAGYFLAAKTWVPFVTPERAFILYLCWEQSRLRGNAVTLEALSDRETIVRISPRFFALYKQAGHLKSQIAFEDYRLIFETIWKDRAAAAGWDLRIDYGDPECLSCVLRFKRGE
jgi:hypothetical protein